MSKVEKEHAMRIEVNSNRRTGEGGTWTDVADWSRDNEDKLREAIVKAVQELGFPNLVIVDVSY